MGIEPILIQTRGDGLSLQAAIWNGEGKPILCIHGLTANCRCWDLLASGLAPRHRVVALDLRGRGHSEAPSSGYSLAHHVRDILALLDDLSLERPVVLGHSLGAFIALALAASQPQRVDRVVLVDGGGEFTAAQRAKVFEGIKPSLERLGKVFPSFEAYISLLKQAPSFQPWNPFLDSYFRHEVQTVEGGIRSRVNPEHIQEEILNLKAVSPAQFYSRIGSPVLILRATKGMLAEDDLVLPEEAVERMIREIPNVRRVDLEGVDHYAILFQPNPKRDQALLQFLES